MELNYLKILIIYDTVSVNRNTDKVAKTMREVLKEKGFEVDCLYVKDVDPASVKNYDCVLAGSPTHWHKATGPIMQFLERLGEGAFSGKLASAFDTQFQMPLSGNAANGIEKKLEKLGFKIVMPSLVTYVQSKKDVDSKSGIKMKDGELEKAKKYTEELAHKLH